MKTIKSKTFALVTGASSGIGRAIAEALAQRGKNILLVALPEPALYDTASYIHSVYGVQVLTYPTDLSQPANCEELCEWIEKNKTGISILVNNAGIGCTGAFDNYSTSFYQKQISLNVTSLTLLTRLLINELKQHNESYILNVGSLGGFFCVPFKNVYAATKSFVISFSKSLRNELINTNISVSVLCPGGVATNAETIARIQHHGWMAHRSAMTSCEVAEQAIKKLLRKKAVIIPGKLNNIFLLLDRLIPTIIKQQFILAEFSKVARAA